MSFEGHLQVGGEEVCSSSVEVPPVSGEQVPPFPEAREVVHEGGPLFEAESHQPYV